MPQNKGRGKVLTNHLLERAPRGNVQDQLEIAHALQLGLAVDRDSPEAARFERPPGYPPSRAFKPGHQSAFLASNETHGTNSFKRGGQ
jgi:hypothetical protein